MSLRKFTHTNAVIVDPAAKVVEAAELMKRKNVGSVIVVDYQKPVGILTDRDIVLRVVTEGLDASNTSVGEVMTKELATLPQHLGLYEALEQIKQVGVRRFPLVDTEEHLAGIFTLDDVLLLLGKEMSDVATILQEESLVQELHPI